MPRPCSICSLSISGEDIPVCTFCANKFRLSWFLAWPIFCRYSGYECLRSGHWAFGWRMLYHLFFLSVLAIMGQGGITPKAGQIKNAGEIPNYKPNSSMHAWFLTIHRGCSSCLRWQIALELTSNSVTSSRQSGSDACRLSKWLTMPPWTKRGSERQSLDAGEATKNLCGSTGFPISRRHNIPSVVSALIVIIDFITMR